MLVLSVGVGAHVSLEQATAGSSGREPANSSLEGSAKPAPGDASVHMESAPVLDLEAGLDGGDGVGAPSDYISKPVGQKERWQFDSGYFEYDNQQSNRLPSGDTRGDYSGIRLRRPRQKD